MESQDLESQAPANSQTRAVEAVPTSDSLEETPVLVAVDFSPGCEAALIWACGYADRIGAPLEILHVIHDPADSPGTYKPENGDPFEPMADVAERKLAEFLDRIGSDNPDLPCFETALSHCTPGLPASTILQVAQDRGAQHLVLGNGVRRGLGRFLHGSTANQIAGHAQLPVTIVRADG